MARKHAQVRQESFEIPAIGIQTERRKNRSENANALPIFSLHFTKDCVTYRRFKEAFSTVDSFSGTHNMRFMFDFN